MRKLWDVPYQDLPLKGGGGPPAHERQWKLNGGQLADLGFRLQHPLDPYVLDFYCPALKLAIELDGSQHGEDEVLARDARRTAYLRSMGIKTIRFWNREIFEGMDGVLETILDRLETLRRRSQ